MLFKYENWEYLMVDKDSMLIKVSEVWVRLAELKLAIQRAEESVLRLEIFFVHVQGQVVWS